jgi:hypothetical protein
MSGRSASANGAITTGLAGGDLSELPSIQQETDMGVELTVKITTPLDEDDHDLLSGVAVMVLAIANREMAKEAFPGAFPDDQEPGAEGASEDPRLCDSVDRDDPRRRCVGALVHRGRHRYRPAATADSGPAPKLRN